MPQAHNWNRRRSDPRRRPGRSDSRNERSVQRSGRGMSSDVLQQERIGLKIYERITTLAYNHCGVDLRHGKEQLVSVRLGKKMRELGCSSYEGYLALVEQDRTGESLTAMIDALTTNYTSFLREPSHFEFMKQEVLPELEKRDRIEIWSAAS